MADREKFQKKIDALKTHREKRVCPDHGEYEAFVLPGFGSEILVQRCPKCIEIEQQQIKTEARQHEIQQKLIGAGLQKRELDYSFDTFVAETDDQKKALAVCQQFANSEVIFQKGSCLALFGGLGVGKTGLLASIVRRMIERGLTVRYYVADELYRDIKLTYHHTSKLTERALMDQVCTFDVLLIDEIGLQGGKSNEILTFSAILDMRYRKQLPTVLSSNMSESEIGGFLGNRTWERLRDNGKALQLTGESKRGRRTA